MIINTALFLYSYIRDTSSTLPSLMLIITNPSTSTLLSLMILLIALGTFLSLTLMLIQVNKFVTMSYFLESSVPAILFTFGRDRAPQKFYERSSLAHSQVDFIKESKISPQIFSAAEDLIAVEGNVFVRKKQGNLLNDTYYVNSSRFLV